jgi:hypothetical protein
MAKPERLYLVKIQTIFGNRSPTMPTGVVGLFAFLLSDNIILCKCQQEVGTSCDYLVRLVTLKKTARQANQSKGCSYPLPQAKGGNTGQHGRPQRENRKNGGVWLSPKRSWVDEKPEKRASYGCQPKGHG